MKASKLLLIAFFSYCSCNNIKHNKEAAEKENSVELKNESSSTLTDSNEDTFNKTEIVKLIDVLSDSIKKGLSEYDSIQKTIFGYSTEGSELTGFYDKYKKIKLIYAKTAGETGNVIADFYFKNDSLIYIHSFNSSYDRPISTKYISKVISVDEERFYLFRNKLIKWTIGNKEVIENGDNWINRAEEITKYTREYQLELLKK